MKRAVVVALALLLSSCAAFQRFDNPLTKNRLAEIEAAYGAAASLALAGRNACAAKALPRTCRTIVVQVQKADNYAYNQLLVARSFVKNNPQIDATAILATTKAAVDAYQTAAAQIQEAR